MTSFAGQLTYKSAVDLRRIARRIRPSSSWSRPTPRIWLPSHGAGTVPPTCNTRSSSSPGFAMRIGEIAALTSANAGRIFGWSG